MKKKRQSYAVIGLGRFGLSIVEELTRLGHDVIALDTDEEAVERVSKYLPNAYICDSTNEKALRDLDIKAVSNAIVCFGNNLTASILTTVILKDLNIPHITVRMDDEFYIPTILRLGADEVVTPQKLAGIGLANRLGNENFIDYYRLGGTYSVVKITIRDDFKQMPIIELNPRNLFDVNIILIERGKKISAPKARDLVCAGDIIHAVGKRKEIVKFTDFINEKTNEEIARILEKKTK